MGNIVSDNTDNKLFINKEISSIIEEWAKNEYDAGLGWGRKDIFRNNINIKNLLQKRACCTQTPVINIALPIINLEASSEANIIARGYTPVKIRVFNDDDFTKKPELCNFYDESSPNSLNKVVYLQNFTGKQNTNGNCTSLYTSGGSNLGLCRKIKDERKLMYNNQPARSAYSYYATDEKVLRDNSLAYYNNYTDCNCENSILRDIPLEGVFGFSNINNREVFVQSNDSYCTTCSTNGACYVSAKEAISALCINISNVQNSIAENASNITNVQTCQLDNQVGQTENVDDNKPDEVWLQKYLIPPTTSSAPPINVPQGNNNNTIVLIIAITILVAIIIVGVIIIKLYKNKNINLEQGTETIGDTIESSKE
jgi:hypothetical protein